MEKRCKKCNKLLFIENNNIKQIKVNYVEYKINGSIEILCKCGKINKF